MSNKYKRLEGLKEAAKQGFDHTNKARVEMSQDEELIKRKAKTMPPASEKDIDTVRRGQKKMEDKIKKKQKDPDPEFLNV